MPVPEPEAIKAKDAEEQKKLLTVNELNVTLAVFSAEVEVRLDERMKKELLRATKKNPPATMKYELIYVCSTSRRIINVNNHASFRPERTSMTRVKRMSRLRRPLEASSKVSAQI